MKQPRSWEAPLGRPRWARDPRLPGVQGPAGPGPGAGLCQGGTSGEALAAVTFLSGANPAQRGGPAAAGRAGPAGGGHAANAETPWRRRAHSVSPKRHPGDSRGDCGAPPGRASAALRRAPGAEDVPRALRRPLCTEAFLLSRTLSFPPKEVPKNSLCASIFCKPGWHSVSHYDFTDWHSSGRRAQTGRSSPGARASPMPLSCLFNVVW